MITDAILKDRLKDEVLSLIDQLNDEVDFIIECKHESINVDLSYLCDRVQKRFDQYQGYANHLKKHQS